MLHTGGHRRPRGRFPTAVAPGGGHRPDALTFCLPRGAHAWCWGSLLRGPLLWVQRVEGRHEGLQIRPSEVVVAPAPVHDGSNRDHESAKHPEVLALAFEQQELGRRPDGPARAVAWGSSSAGSTPHQSQDLSPTFVWGRGSPKCRLNWSMDAMQ